ncbi:CNH protein [Rhizoctonia solani]|uniref:CNH protein n=1 Tax=Rhizoctonia solani TaxID=456999 RepID=A0A8H7I5B6_9AGAM|nr:CNH protein [Rhizoctonia solani]
MESALVVAAGNNKRNTGYQHMHPRSIGSILTTRTGRTSTSDDTLNPYSPILQPHRYFKSRRRPLVYPALLSCVAKAFREHIPLANHTKGDMTYASTFDGHEAVSIIAWIIKTSDRNLALLLGRALGAQRFFHHIAFHYQLRDSPTEIYQFNTCRRKLEEGEEISLPCSLKLVEHQQGIKIRDCPSCPKRFELEQTQQQHPGSHGHYISNSGKSYLARTWSISELDEKIPGRPWLHSAVQEMDNIGSRENKRQKAIQEIIRVQRDFVQDLEYLRDCWIEPLPDQDIVPADRRIEFIQQVFGKFEEMLDVNRRLCTVITTRQKFNRDTEFIGDAFLEMVPHFQSLVQGNNHRIWGGYELEPEEPTNPAFAAFSRTVEQSPPSRDPKLATYLAKSLVHLTHLLQWLEIILENTPQGSRDTDGECTALRLDHVLMLRPDEQMDFKIRDQFEQRQLVYKGRLKYRGGVIKGNVDLQVFLLDHVLLIVKSKKSGRYDQLTLFKRPIPLELLTVSVPEENGGVFFKIDSQKHGHQLVFSHLGRQGYRITLWASTSSDRKKWIQHITARQRATREQRSTFITYTLSGETFTNAIGVNCAALYDHGQRIAYGTDKGVYLQSLHGGQPVKYLDLPDVQQIDVLEDYQSLIVLSGESNLRNSFHILAQCADAGNLVIHKVALHISLYKVGYCLDRAHICIAGENTSEGTTIRIKEINGIMCRIGVPLPSESTCEAAERLSNDVHALGIYPIDGLFLLCYTVEFAFYVYETGRRSKNNTIIRWEGAPTTFALQYPYIMAFDPMFVEIRHVKNGSLVQIIRGSNIRLLYADIQSPDAGSTISTLSSQSRSVLSAQFSQGRIHGRDSIVLASDDGVMMVKLSAWHHGR